MLRPQHDAMKGREERLLAVGDEPEGAERGNA